VDPLRAAGAQVFEVPTIVIGPPPDPEALAAAVGRLGLYDWVVFTSGNAVRAVADVLRLIQMDLPSSLKVASVGRATSAAVEAAWPGRPRPPLEPVAEFSAEGLLAAWRGMEVRGARVLLPVSDRAADILPRGLAERGAEVERVIAYTTTPQTGGAAAWAEAREEGVDLVVFASPSAVEGFVALAGASAAEAPAAVIGPTTAAAARGAGLDVLVQPSESTMDALAAAIVASLAAS
jgi:uroporphyrinogen-III synthase